jgi:hypothetical protein
MDCKLCKNTGVFISAFGTERVRAFCSCNIGRQKAAEAEAARPKKYTTSYDEKEISLHNVGKSGIIHGNNVDDALKNIL